VNQTPERIRSALAAVEDPEVPVTLRDLGVMRSVDVSHNRVGVVLRPTRLACPAREEMARRVRAAVTSVAPDFEVEVRWELERWRGSEVSARGAGSLLQIGYADPTRSGKAACPYCGSSQVERHGEFGGAVCKVPFTCRACGSSFDALKGSAAADAATRPVTAELR
jgi:ring-1,2-phenylacetyl-CoA epoxidase subunit PaaD